RRHRLRHRPHRRADGRHRIHPRRDRVPQDHHRAVPDDRRAVAGAGAAAARGARGDPTEGMSRALAIRRAGPGDAAALAELGAKTFTLTFGHMYPPEDLAAYLAESHSEACYAGLL